MSKSISFAIFLALVIFSTFPSFCETLNITQRGTPADDIPYGVALHGSAIYVAGYTEAAMDSETHSGRRDMVLLKFDKDATWQWTRQIGTSNDDMARGVAVDTHGAVYVAGCTSGMLGVSAFGIMDIVLLKYDKSGTLIFKHQRGTMMPDEAWAVAVDSVNDIYVAGFSLAAFDGQAHYGLKDMVVMKFTCAGNVCDDISGGHLWTRQRGSVNADAAFGLAFDASNSVYIVGEVRGPMDFQPFQGEIDTGLVKFSSVGDWQWTRLRGGPRTDSAKAIAIDSRNDVYIAGKTDGEFDRQKSRGNDDMFLIKYSPLGEWMWTRQTGTAGGDFCRCLFVDLSDMLYLIGSNVGDMDGLMKKGGWDTNLIQYGPTGYRHWTEVFGSPEDDKGESGVVAADGTAYIASYTLGSLGGQNAGRNDIALIKYNRKFDEKTYETTRGLKGTMGVRMTKASTFLQEPNVTEVVGQAISVLFDVVVTWVQDVRVSLSERRLQISGSSEFQDVEFDWEIVPDGDAVNVTLIAEYYDSLATSEATALILSMINAVYTEGYDVNVSWKYAVLADEDASTTKPSDDTDDTLQTVILLSISAASCAMLSVLVLLVVTLYRRRPKQRSAASISEKVIGDTSYWLNYLSLLQPLDVITVDDGEKARRIAGLMAANAEGDSEIFLIFALGQRSSDADGTGPGMLLALAVMKKFHDHGVHCCSELSFSKEAARSEFRDKMRQSSRKKLLVVQTRALYQSICVLEDLSYACEQGVDLLPLRFETDLPPPEEQWSTITRTDLDGMLMVTKVQDVLNNTVSSPSEPYTVPDQPSVLDDLLASLSKRLVFAGAGLPEHLALGQGQKIEQDIQPLLSYGNISACTSIGYAKAQALSSGCDSIEDDYTDRMNSSDSRSDNQLPRLEAQTSARSKVKTSSMPVARSTTDQKVLPKVRKKVVSDIGVSKTGTSSYGVAKTTSSMREREKTSRSKKEKREDAPKASKPAGDI